VESSRLDHATLGRINRHTISISAGYRRDETRTFSKLEFRKDEGSAERTQWLTTHRIDVQVSEDLGFVGKLNLAVTEDGTDRTQDARFAETDLGVAYRPAAIDRWQLIGKYTFLYDLPSAAQITPGSTDERLHVVAVESLYDIVPAIGVGGKVATRWAQLRTERNQGDWFDSRTYLGVLRGVFHAPHRWDGLVEYRWLETPDAEDRRQGVLIAGYRALSDRLKAGVGFNFTDFSDDLTDLGYDNRGVFVNVVGAY